MWFILDRLCELSWESRFLCKGDDLLTPAELEMSAYEECFGILVTAIHKYRLMQEVVELYLGLKRVHRVN